MKLCKHCYGAIAEDFDVFGGYSGKWCTCIKTNTALHIGPAYEPAQDSISAEDYMKQKLKDNIKKPNFSHIINLCEQLTADQLRILIEVLKAMQEAEK